ncbi:hypothetical protein BIW11_03459 [Tropilaelaps mercedesae]|uniref:Uncharacterized protein n=1 Tax=Tropilaelaps mercedesae TaxID=418985 RepID=A0A1V9XKV8_9ACAR|nr:hypothetical protein BIW11_03459 [Tropilaelaps mercedesae]
MAAPTPVSALEF